MVSGVAGLGRRNGATTKMAAPMAAATPILVARDSAATGWWPCRYLRGLEWNGVNATSIGGDNGGRRCRYVLSPLVLSAICDVLIVSFRL